MHRIDGPGATPENMFTDGDPVAGTPATVVTDDFMNDVQEELIGLLTAAGITPVKGTQDQVLKSLAKLLQGQKLTAFPTAGTPTALTLTPSPAIDAYEASQRFRVKFSVASGIDPTLNVSGKGAKGLKQYDSAGNKVAASFAAGQLSDVECDGVDMVMLNSVSSVSDASTTAKGKVQLATATESQAWTDPTKAITPASLNSAFAGGNQALTTNGFQKLPGGLIVQWIATGPISATPLTLTFPAVFPNQALGVVGTNYLGATNVTPTQDALAFYGLTTSGVSARTNAGALPSAKIIVIGF